MVQIISIIEDDTAVRESVFALLETEGYAVQAFSSAEDFLTDGGMQSDCVITDVRMAGMSGLQLLDRLYAQTPHLPVIVITGHADVSLAVHAMRAGAVDFVEKPFDAQMLLASVARALDCNRMAQDRATKARESRDLLGLLTEREQEVLVQLAHGQSNKSIANELRISPRTTEIHRAHIMKKLGARSLADLVRIYLLAA